MVYLPEFRLAAPTMSVPQPATGGVPPTDMFMLPDTWAPAGATPIGTVADLLSFGRVFLAGGVAPPGTRVLTAESVARMRSVTRSPSAPGGGSPPTTRWSRTARGSTR